MNLDKAFKLYDIRGSYPEEVSEHLAFLLGSVLTDWKKPKKVAIAGDVRKSTPALKRYLIDGFGNKVQISDLGEVPVPEFYFTVATKKFDLGVMITASHLHADENGFKLVTKGGLPLDQAEVQALKKQMVKKSYPKIIVPPKPVEHLHITDDYVDSLIKASGLKEIKLKLVLDTIRSSTSTVVPQVFKKLNAKYTLTRSDHEGNPLMAENRKELEQSVQSLRANLGIIWDSDGDRVAFVDKTGKFIPMSFVLGLLAADEVKRHTKGKKVAVDVRAGLVVRDLVEAAGGSVEVFPAWHVSLKFAMTEDPSIVFAGETTGHFIYKNFHKIDDGILAALKFIKFAQENDLELELKKLSHRYFELPEMNFKVDKDKSSQILENLANSYREKGNQVSLMDGLTVLGDSWKFNLRGSATEPLLRLNLEAVNEKSASDILQKVEAQIH